MPAKWNRWDLAFGMQPTGTKPPKPPHPHRPPATLPGQTLAVATGEQVRHADAQDSWAQVVSGEVETLIVWDQRVTTTGG